MITRGAIGSWSVNAVELFKSSPMRIYATKKANLLEISAFIHNIISLNLPDFALVAIASKGKRKAFDSHGTRRDSAQADNRGT